MPSKVVGYSNKFLGKRCQSCENKKLEIVQTQNYLGIPPIKLIGQGPRTFHAVCTQCGEIHTLNPSQLQKAETLKYRAQEGMDGEPVLSSTASGKSETKYYPVLDEKRREEIRKSNFKEGFTSLVVGLVIGLIVLGLPWDPYVLYIGGFIVIYSIIGGLYAAFEDPEKKHRDLLENKKNLL